MATRKKAAKKAAKKSSGAAAITQERLLGALHQVWLAGLGAVSKAQSGAPKLLEELVAEGARTSARAYKATDAVVRGALSDAQSAILGTAGDVREKAADAFDNLEKIFQTRVHRVLKQLGVPSEDEIAGLSKRVDALNRNIEKLGRGREGVHKVRAISVRKVAAHSASAA
jgi:poly(hydroxyalkanoate) granule-associated protein